MSRLLNSIVYLAMFITLGLLLYKDIHMFSLLFFIFLGYFLYQKSGLLVVLAIVSTLLMISNVHLQYKKLYSSPNPLINSNHFTCKISSFFEVKGNQYKVICKNKKRVILIINQDLINDVEDLNLGNTVVVKGNFTTPKNATTPHVFDYRQYLMSRKISGLVYVEQISVIKQSIMPLERLKIKIFKHIDDIKYNKEYGFAIILGNRNNFDSDYIKNIQALNISHLFAISGLHIGLIVKVIFELLRRCRLKEITIQICISLLVLFYCYLTNFSASITRASLFIIILFIKQRLDLRVTNINILSLIYISLLFINPFSLFNIGFVLSFLITAVFIISNSLMSNQKGKFRSLLMLNTVAQLFSIPIIATINYSYNFLSVITNIPLSLLYMIFILPASIIIVIFPNLSPFFRIVFELYESIISVCSSLPYLTLGIGAFSTTRFLIYMTLLYLILKRVEHGIKIVYIIPIFLFVMTLWNSASPHDEVIFFDVGQGDSSLIRSSFNRCTSIIDTSGKISFNNRTSHPSRFSVIPYMKSQSIKTVNYLFITHGDVDHANDYLLFFEEFYIKNVVLSSYDDSKLKKDIISVANKNNVNIILIDQRTTITCKNITYTLLSPTRNYGSVNDNSLAILVTINTRYELLFMGDLSKQVERDVIKNNLNHTSILKIAHHGSNTSTSQLFLDYIEPDIAIISVGKNNYGHPEESVLNRLERTKVNYYRTDQDGSIKVNYLFGRYRIIKNYSPYNNRYE